MSEKLEIGTFVFNPFEENTFIINISGSNAAIIVDPGCDSAEEKERLESYLAAKNLRPVAILLTHGHLDHTRGVAYLQKHYGIPVYGSPLDDEKINATIKGFFDSLSENFDLTPVEDGQHLNVAGLDFTIITTPGHSPGGVCFHEENEHLLITGDTLFAGAIGRSDLPGGDYDKLIVSIMDKLMGSDGDTCILPGHGPSTTIADERTNNPFLQPFNEPEEGEDSEAEPLTISHEC